MGADANVSFRSITKALDLYLKLSSQLFIHEISTCMRCYSAISDAGNLSCQQVLHRPKQHLLWCHFWR